MTVDFLLGESKKVRVKVISELNEPFEILSATWELRKFDKIEANGDCLIDGHTLIAQISPMFRSEYELDFSYNISSEILKSRVVVNVR